MVVVVARGEVERVWVLGVLVGAGGLPLGFGVADEGIWGVVDSVVLAFGGRGVRSEVTRPPSESSEAWPDIGGESFGCEEELMMTAIRDGVRTRVGVAGIPEPAAAWGEPAGVLEADLACAMRACGGRFTGLIVGWK